uniref:Uncharacterized protein n=2 Tax=Plectus sambesii TaxID=2011161 RepID=A0A914XHT1_9BILA
MLSSVLLVLTVTLVVTIHSTASMPTLALIGYESEDVSSAIKRIPEIARLRELRSSVRSGRPNGPLRFGKRRAGPSGPIRFGKRRTGPSGPLRFGKRWDPIAAEPYYSIQYLPPTTF